VISRDLINVDDNSSGPFALLGLATWTTRPCTNSFLLSTAQPDPISAPAGLISPGTIARLGHGSSVLELFSYPCLLAQGCKAKERVIGLK